MIRKEWSAHLLRHKSSPATTTPLVKAATLRFRNFINTGARMLFHGGINTLRANPKLLSDAAIQGVSVFTYHFGSDREHAEALRKSAQSAGFWPTGAIIDADANSFCEDLSVARK